MIGLVLDILALFAVGDCNSEIAAPDDSIVHYNLLRPDDARCALLEWAAHGV